MTEIKSERVFREVSGQDEVAIIVDKDMEDKEMTNSNIENNNVTKMADINNEEEKMKYNELSKLMNEVNKDRPWEDYGPYEIVEWSETVDIIAESGCYEYGFDYWNSLEDASKMYYEHLSETIDQSFEDIIVGCNGELYEIKETMKEMFCDGLWKLPDECLEEFILDLGLEEELADRGYIEYERQYKSLKETFVEFCAYHHCHLKDLSNETIQEYLRYINYFPKEMRESSLSEIDEDELQEYLENCADDTEMGYPFTSFIGFCNELFDYAIETQICDFNPASDINWKFSRCA